MNVLRIISVLPKFQTPGAKSVLPHFVLDSDTNYFPIVTIESLHEFR